MRIAAILLIASTASALAVEDVDGSLAKLAAPEKAALLDRMEQDLFDGPASRLRDVRKIDKARMCGRINPKNRMGAYIGYREFMFDPEREELLLGGEDADDSAKGQVKAACR